VEKNQTDAHGVMRSFNLGAASHYGIVNAKHEKQLRADRERGRPDGTDGCMQVYAGFLLSQRVYSEFIVATGDHFGPVLCEMIECDSLLWEACRARHVTSAKQV
jgi:hypothetical protein